MKYLKEAFPLIAENKALKPKNKRKKAFGKVA